jgi:hypothetical protein
MLKNLMRSILPSKKGGASSSDGSQEDTTPEQNPDSENYIPDSLEEEQPPETFGSEQSKLEW